MVGAAVMLKQLAAHRWAGSCLVVDAAVSVVALSVTHIGKLQGRRHGRNRRCSPGSGGSSRTRTPSCRAAAS